MSSPRFRGIIPPLITPLIDRDTLDFDGLARLIDHVIRGGVHGVFALGTTGEGPCLSYRLRREIIKRVGEEVGGRVPVFISVTDTSFVESVELSKAAAEAGADVVVLSVPYYFPAGQTELIQYIERILPQLALPVMLYNIPSLTKVGFELDTLKTVSGFDRIYGVKDSGGDLTYFEDLCRLNSIREDWSFLMGPEDKLIQGISLGGHGGVNGGANVYPRLFVDAYQAAIGGDEATAARLQKKIEAFGQIYSIGKYASRFVKGTKCAASILGLCRDTMAEPFNRFYPEDRAKVEAILNNLDDWKSTAEIPT